MVMNSAKWKTLDAYPILLPALGLLAVAAICIFGAYKSYSCSSLCIYGFSQRGDYMVAARMSYTGLPLPNTKVTVIANGAYKSTVATDSDSSLLFRAPLRLGVDSIEVEYGGSRSSVRFLYMGGLLYMLLIPLSALLFLLLKGLTLDPTKMSRVTFHANDGSWPDAGDMPLKNAIDSVIKKAKRFVPGLPERISDISEELARISKVEGGKKIGKDPHYLSQKMAARQIAFTSFGCVCKVPISREAAAAREIYERSIIAGTPSLFSSKNPRVLLSANKAIFSDNLSIGFLSKAVKRGCKIRLFLSDYAEVHSLSRLARSYTKVGATLLLLQAGDILEMIMLGE
jgi:hypothetical protein